VSAAADSDPFQALADPRRRQILEVLAGGPTDVGELARRCGLTRPLTAHHLGVMQRAGLVRVRLRCASVRPEPLEALRRYFDDALTAAAISSPNA
jgi:DNA-binding transcriptional ArsR family regulator